LGEFSVFVVVIYVVTGSEFYVRSREVKEKADVQRNKMSEYK
jgi:hypothetical protein